MEVLRAIEQLFTDHAPETLMAFFGAVTSIVLLYLIWSILRHWFGLQTLTAGQDASQDQANTALVEALVSALVSEASHLRVTMDGILSESIQRGHTNAALLTDLSERAEALPEDVVRLLNPEFEHLRREMRQVEARIITKVLAKQMETRDPAAEHAQEASEHRTDR